MNKKAALFLFVLLICLSEGAYLTNEQLYQRMLNASRLYPDISYLYSIGKSVNGTDLWVLAISGTSPRSHVTLRPETKYVGNIHGNEPLGRELLVRLIDYLLSSYGSEPSVTRLLLTTRVHIMPVMNPDGFAQSTEGQCMGMDGRWNYDGVDLNRDFPDVFNPKHRKLSELQPESLAIVKWLDSIQFVLSAHFHGGSMVVNYPYDSVPLGTTSGLFADISTPSISEDDDTFQFLSRKYSFAHKTMRLGDCPRFKDGITNGAAWYYSLGSMQDYNYAFAGCMEVSIELHCCKYPETSYLESYWDDNREALITYLSQVDMGVKGIILYSDAKPAAGVEVHVDKRRPVKTTTQGEYWKLLLPGNYTLKVIANSEVLSSIDVTVSEAYASVYNITLPYSSNTMLARLKDNSADKLPVPSVALQLILLYCVIMIF